MTKRDDLIGGKVMTMRTLALLAVAAVAAVACGGTSSGTTGSTITLGAPLGLTGSLAKESLLTQQGYNLWQDWINSQGGIVVWSLGSLASIGTSTASACRERESLNLHGIHVFADQSGSSIRRREITCGGGRSPPVRRIAIGSRAAWEPYWAIRINVVLLSAARPARCPATEMAAALARKTAIPAPGLLAVFTAM